MEELKKIKGSDLEKIFKKILDNKGDTIELYYSIVEYLIKSGNLDFNK